MKIMSAMSSINPAKWMRPSIVSLTLLPVRSANAPKAVGTALWRQFVTHRGLLDWQTSAQVESEKNNHKVQTFQARTLQLQQHSELLHKYASDI